MVYEFGARLLQLRKAKNLTQQALVDRAKALDPDLLFGAALLIALLAPANNAALHLSEEEIAAIRPRALARLALAVLAGCALLCGSIMLANCVAVSLFAIAALLVFSNLGLGTQ